MHKSIYLFEHMLVNSLILFIVQIENHTELLEEKDTQNNFKRSRTHLEDSHSSISKPTFKL